MAINISSTHRLTLDEPPACLAFCPSRPELFVVGGYVLHPTAPPSTKPEPGDDEDESTAEPEKTEQKRTGSLTLYRIANNEIHHLSTLPIASAILDAHFPPHNPLLLALATSTGQLVFYTLSPPPEPPQLHLHASHTIADPSTLILSLVWHPINPNIIGCTLSDGTVALFTSSDSSWSSSTSLTSTTLPGHDLEPWHLAFRSPDQILTGGDDGVIQLSQRGEDGDWTSLWRDRKLHTAGVTAVLPVEGTEMVVTGCYDDRIRLVDCPVIGRRVVLAEMDLGGGVWRLRRLGEERGGKGEVVSLTMLASCMHAGSRVVRLQRDEELEWEFVVLASFTEHGSMNYGSEVQPSIDGERSSVRTVVSTSFYDKLMCLWRVDIGEQRGEVERTEV